MFKTQERDSERIWFRWSGMNNNVFSYSLGTKDNYHHFILCCCGGWSELQMTVVVALKWNKKGETQLKRISRKSNAHLYEKMA